MPEWICPSCGGGFPSGALVDDTACPWCQDVLGDVPQYRTIEVMEE